MSRSTTRLHNIWHGMKDRCCNPNCKSFDDYGGRGITVCDEWRDSFNAFEDWAYANGYREYLSIDRENVNGNYEPSNCRWATGIEQSGNKRNPTRKHTFNGETLTARQWAEKIGIPHDRINQRLRAHPTDLEKVFSPVNGASKHLVEINGEVKPLKTWARMYGISWAGIRRRYAKGLRGSDLIAPTSRQRKRPNATPSKVER